MSKIVKGTRALGTDSSLFNILNFLMETKIKGMVNTAIPVVVTDVSGGGTDNGAGYVSVKPLLNQIDADGNALDVPEIFNLPYFRFQGGKAAVVIDPEKDDIGLAVFAQQDVSGLKEGGATPTVPPSFRCFDLADGFYIGGFLNKAPEIWLELKGDTAKLHTTGKVVIESKNMEVTLDESAKVECKDITLKGDSSIVLNSSKVEVGSDASSPITKGDILKQFLDTLIKSLQSHVHTSAAPGVDTSSSITLASLQVPNNLNSEKAKVG